MERSILSRQLMPCAPILNFLQGRKLGLSFGIVFALIEMVGVRKDRYWYLAARAISSCFKKLVRIVDQLRACPATTAFPVFSPGPGISSIGR